MDACEIATPEGAGACCCSPLGDHHGRTVGSATTSLLLQVLLLMLLPISVLGVFYPQQNITDKSVTFCGFFELKRYTAWCDSYISAFVASNLSCISYGVCIPLEGYEQMSCTNRTYCSGLQRDGKAQPACLVLQSTVNDTVAKCDVDIQGPSLYDSPPPSPPPPGPKAPPDEKKNKDWPLWKTMTIVFSIVGFALFVVVVVLLVLWYKRRKARASETPVKLLSEEEKQKIEQEAHAQEQQQPPGQPAGEGVVHPLPLGLGYLGYGYPGIRVYSGLVDGVTDTVRPTSPDGKPIFAYGATYPRPQSLKGSILPIGHRRLPPNAGDALIRAAVSSREVYNSAPMRRAPLILPPPVAAPNGWPGGGAVDAAAASLPPHTDATAAAAAVDAMGEGLLHAVVPAALMPLAAATLQNPTAAS